LKGQFLIKFCPKGTSVLSPVIPFGLVVVPAVVISAMSTQQVYENNPCLYILAFGMVAAKVTNKLVVSNLLLKVNAWLKNFDCRLPT